MRKKIVALLAVIAVMAVVLSVTAFAAESKAGLTDYGIITVMFESLKLTAKSFFGVIDKIYLFFANLFA